MERYLVRTAWLLAALVTSSVQAQDFATLKMKIHVKGITPEPQSFDSGTLVVGANGELSNFVVMFDEDKSKLIPPVPEANLPLNDVHLEIQSTQIKPRISVCRPDQAISITNASPEHQLLSIRSF